MTRHYFLLALNVFLATVILAVLLGCGCDPADPPSGSLAEKLCGRWTSDPVVYTVKSEDEKMLEKTTRIEIRFSYWTSGMTMWYTTLDIADAHHEHSTAGDFTYEGNMATTRKPGFKHEWTIQLDDQDPKLAYVTWILSDGTTRLDRVRFTKGN